MKKDIHPKMYMYKRIVEAKLFIDTNYSEKIELDGLSNKACFSKYHFLRLFKSSFGKSPHQYLTEVRLLNARKLLSQNKPVSSVCYEVGFDSIPSFTKLFKKHVGVTPKEFFMQYQLQHKRKKSSPFSFVPHCFAESYGWIK